MNEEQTRPTALLTIVLLARILLHGINQFLEKVINDESFNTPETFSKCFFSCFTINQKRDTFQMLNRLTKLLLSIGEIFKNLAPKEV